MPSFKPPSFKKKRKKVERKVKKERKEGREEGRKVWGKKKEKKEGRKGRREERRKKIKNLEWKDHLLKVTKKLYSKDSILWVPVASPPPQKKILKQIKFHLV